MSRNVILWVAGFAGLMLLYSAYKNEKPLAILMGQKVDSHGDPTGTVGNAWKNLPGNKGAIGEGPVDPGPVTSFGGLPVGPVSYDQNGNTIEVPPMYSSSPATYRPGNLSA